MTETPPSVAETSIEQLRLHGQRLQLLANPYVVGLATAQVLTPEDLDVLRSIPGTVPADLVALLDVRLQQAVEEANTSFFRFDLRTLEAFAEGSSCTLNDGDTLLSDLADEPTRKLRSGGWRGHQRGGNVYFSWSNLTTTSMLAISGTRFS